MVENALVISVFLVFLFGIIEFGHVYLVINTLNAAAKRAARHGAVEDVTTQEVVARVNEILAQSIDPDQATVLVKDASVFDSPGVDAGSVVYEDLPNIELADASARQLYVVRITVPYSSVSLIPPFWAKDAVLRGQSVMRHE